MLKFRAKIKGLFVTHDINAVIIISLNKFVPFSKEGTKHFNTQHILIFFISKR